MRVYAQSMLSRTDDATLVRRMQAGDERAFEEIFKRHHAPLLSYCRHMLGNQAEGEDALQQAFIKAHQALLGGNAPRELRPWLYAIARNCCLSAIAARRTTAPLQDDTPALAGLTEEVHRREDLRELVAGIGRLPEDQRSALLLAELDDLDHRAIATIVGCEVSKVKALIYQARSALIADRDARETPCEDIREQLAVARGGELRRGPLRRHLKLCVGCRDFQLAVNAQRQSLGVRAAGGAQRRARGGDPRARRGPCRRRGERRRQRGARGAGAGLRGERTGRGTGARGSPRAGTAAATTAVGAGAGARRGHGHRRAGRRRAGHQARRRRSGRRAGERRRGDRPQPRRRTRAHTRDRNTPRIGRHGSGEVPSRFLHRRSRRRPVQFACSADHRRSLGQAELLQPAPRPLESGSAGSGSLTELTGLGGATSAPESAPAAHRPPRRAPREHRAPRPITGRFAVERGAAAPSQTRGPPPHPSA